MAILRKYLRQPIITGFFISVVIRRYEPGRELLNCNQFLLWEVPKNRLFIAVKDDLHRHQTTTPYVTAVHPAQYLEAPIAMQPANIVGGNKTTAVNIRHINYIDNAR